MSRYRYRPVTVPLQFTVLRYGPLPFFLNVTDRYPSLRTVTQAVHALPNVTCVTERYMRYRTLHNLTDRYRALQALLTDFMNFRKFK